MSDFATPALEAANLGLPVFPCRPGSKVPAIKGWQRVATTDPQTILAMAEEHRRANVGIAARDWFALDVDGAEGERTLERLELDLPATLENGTRRGRHLIFRGRLPFRPPARLGPGLDVKGNFQGKPTGYLLAPTSMVDGHVYRWRNDCGIALAPPDLVELLRKGHSADPDLRFGRPIYKGERNTMLTQQAGRLVRDGFTSVDAIEAALQAQNLARCRPPLLMNEVTKIAKSAARWERSPLWLTEPMEFARDERLSARARLVLLALTSHARIDNEARPGIRRLCAMTGLARATVGKAIDELEGAGRISVRRSRRGNRYLILPYEPYFQHSGTSVLHARTVRPGDRQPLAVVTPGQGDTEK